MVVYPETRSVAVHQPGQPVDILTADDMLALPEILPGLAVNIGEVVPDCDCHEAE